MENIIIILKPRRRRLTTAKFDGEIKFSCGRVATERDTIYNIIIYPNTIRELCDSVSVVFTVKRAGFRVYKVRRENAPLI